MYPRRRGMSWLDAVRAHVAGWVLGRRLWVKLYQFHCQMAWNLGKKGRPLPWHEPPKVGDDE